MKPQVLGYDQERRLLKVAGEVSDGVAEGLTPTEAVIKSASEHKLTPGQIERVCAAYNVGVTNEQRESGKTLEEKFASVPLADAEKAISGVYSAGRRKQAMREAAAFCPQSPQFVFNADRQAVKNEATAEKRASGVLFGKRTEEANRAADGFPSSRTRTELYAEKMALVRQGATEARQAVISLQRKVARAADSLLRHLADPRQGMPADRFEAGARLVYGPELASALVDHLTDLRPSLKRASDKTVFSGEVNRRAMPWSAATEILEACRELQTAKEASDVWTRKEAELPAGLRPFLTPQAYKEQKPIPQVVQEKQYDLEDPDHDQALEQIRTQAMLHDLMANDEFLSKAKPDDVLAAYNEFASLTPRAARQPSVVRSILRQSVQQLGTAPHELGQMTDIERTLAERNRGDLPAERRIPQRQGPAA